MNKANEKQKGPNEIMGLMYGQCVPQSSGLKKKALGLICLQRPLVAIMGPLMFLAAAFLALGRAPPASEVMLGFIAVYSLTSAEHTIDDYIDKVIDKKKWPRRPLPTGTISRGGAGIYAICMATFGFALSYILFNWQLLAVEVLALGLGILYPFGRDKIGYLVLSPIPALIGIGGWVAYSPDTLFTSPVPWFLFLVFTGWQAFHILTLPWALTVAKTLFVRPQPRTVARLSVILSLVTLVLALYLSLFLSKTLIFATIMILLSLAFLASAAPLIRKPTNPAIAGRAVMVATNYNVIMCLALMYSVS